MTKEDFLRALEAQHSNCWFPKYFNELVLPSSLTESQLALVYANAVRPALPSKPSRSLKQLLVDFMVHTEYHAELRQAYRPKLDRVIEGCLMANELQLETKEVDPWN